MYGGILGTEDKKKWIVKDGHGAVHGPFFTDEVLRHIRQGKFQGGEKIALFPGTNWIPISQAPEFYDQLLEILEGVDYSEESFERPEVSRPPKNKSEKQGESLNHSFKPDSSYTKQNGPSENTNATSGSSKQSNRAEKVSSSGQESKKSKKDKSEDTSGGQVIELKKAKEAFKNIKSKKAKKPKALIFAVLVLLIAYLFWPTPQTAGDLHLLVPQKGKQAISQQEVINLLREGANDLSQDNFRDYLSAQNKFVKAFEGDNKSEAALSLLCITYYKLWPYTAQDSQDRKTLTIVTQFVSQLNPTSVEAYACRSVDLILRGRNEEAMSNVDSVIDASSNSESPPTVFYFLKAVLQKDKKEYSSAQSYAQAAQQLWPSWLGAYFLEAEALYEGNRHNESLAVLNKILNAKQDHLASQALLGIIEARTLRNFDRAEKFLSAALSKPKEIKKSLLADTYLAMAEINLEQGDQSDALAYAKKSYAISATGSRAKAIILQIGGEESLLETRRLDKELLYEGDQLVREGDCLSAQALYKSAFETNPKNAMAAMKAAECLWKLSLTTEAIDWLNKAINADHKLIDAYVLLADYYSQRYQFLPAGQVLQSAAQTDPRNYKVFRGLALIELRRRNAQGAITYANQAAQLYESDVETYVILARAHVLNGEYNKAITAAGKAVELDVNNRDAQIVYAESLFGAQGAPSSIDYLSRLVDLYPLVVEYRFALGEAYLKNQSYSSAIQMFEQVERMQDKPKKALMALAQAYEEQGNSEKALNYYLEAAAIDPSDVEPVFKSGLVYLNQQKALDARSQFARVLRVNDKYPLANFYLGKAALLLRSPQQALEHAKAEAKLNPNLADPYILAAEAYDALQQFNLCATEFQKAAKLRPASSQLYVKMARCYRLAGSLDAAVSMVNIAKKLESGNPDVYREMGLLFQTKGDNIAALEAYNQYLILAPNAPDAAQVRRQVDALSQ